ncbi:hypothetical protein TNCV_2811081 [Trichonephila clavipes]|nr:hypothetical protein TNCV_2811081 [Trichonephila clavipes]
MLLLFSRRDVTTTYEGKESSSWSNRSNSEKSRGSRKPSGKENKSCKSDKGNARLEDLRVKRDKAVESTGTSERYDGQRPKNMQETIM